MTVNLKERHENERAGVAGDRQRASWGTRFDGYAHHGGTPKKEGAAGRGKVVNPMMMDDATDDL